MIYVVGLLALLVIVQGIWLVRIDRTTRGLTIGFAHFLEHYATWTAGVDLPGEQRSQVAAEIYPVAQRLRDKTGISE